MDATPIIIKKKKSHAHAHHGGSWKVAYADFVTAMMAFFMVMWIMGLSDDTRAQIQGYFNDPIGFLKNQPKSKTVIPLKGSPNSKPISQKFQPGQAAKQDQKQLSRLRDEIKAKLASTRDTMKYLQHMEFKLTAEGLRIEFLEDKNDFFEIGQATLKPGAKRLIAILAPKLGEAMRPMIIEGHTDARPFGNDPSGNYRLSTERALAVQIALAQDGVPPSKFEFVKGLADRELRDPAHPNSAVNRRVSLLVRSVATPTSTQALPKDEVRANLRDRVAPSLELAPAAPDLRLLKN